MRELASSGLDVHVKTVVACRIYPDEHGKVVKEVMTFETLTDSLVVLVEWLKAADIQVVAIETACK